MILKENRALVENFLESTSYKITRGKNPFKEIILERDESRLLPPKERASDIFNEPSLEDEEEFMMESDSDDDDVFD